MRPEDLDELRQLPLFRDMLASTFSELMHGAVSRSVAQGVELIRQGDPAQYLHVVLEGSVELYGSWQGRSCTMAVINPVGSFILAACIKDAPYLNSARSLMPSRILVVPASDLRATFRRDAEFAVSVIDELAGAYRSVMRHAKGLKLRAARERVAAYLLQQSFGKIYISNGRERFTLSVEKRLIASYLGMTPESFSRALRSLEEFGVEVQGQKITLTDAVKLAAFAPPDFLIDGPDREAGRMGASLPLSR